MRNNLKGFAAIEYIIMILVILAALIGMADFIRRSLSGKYRETGNAFGYGRQYQPGVTK